MMANKIRQSAMTLTELLVVIAVMALLLGISVPTAQRLMDSFESSAGVRSLINAALANARAIAVRHQAYAGVRFQEDADGNTYMIFIIHDPGYNPANAPDPLGTNHANGFRAVSGRKPMKLPEDVGVISPYWINRSGYTPNNWSSLITNSLSDTVLTDNVSTLVQIAGKTRNRYLLDASTFSVVFSPQGKLIIHPVQVWNKDGQTDNSSNDSIFNAEDAAVVMFLQDDYWSTPDYGIGPEMSVQSFKIYSKKQYRQTTDRWSGYLEHIDLDYISPYTGEIVTEYNDNKP